MSPGQGTRIEITQEDHEDGSIAVDAVVRTGLFDGDLDDECAGEQYKNITALSFDGSAVAYMRTADEARELRARRSIEDGLKNNFTKDISRPQKGSSQALKPP